jgi:hypothetical protein
VWGNMSDREPTRGDKEGSGFTPAKVKPSKLSIPEFVELRKALEDSGLAKWVVLAGLGGLVELIRGLVDVVRAIKSF